MQIEYIQKYKDNIIFQEYCFNHNPVIKKQVFQNILIVCIFYILLSIVILSIEKFNIIAVIVICICSAIFLPVFIRVLKNHLRNKTIRLYRQLNKETEQNKETKIIATIENDILTIETATSMLEMKISELKRVEDNKEYYFIFTSDIQAMTLNKNIPQVQSFIEEIKKQMAVKGGIIK